MPIKANFTWTETNDVVKLFVPTRGTPSSKIDIQVTASTLKINFSPYLIDLVLKYPINCSKHKASIVDGVLQIILVKQTLGIWSDIAIDDDEAAKDLKKAALAAQKITDDEMEEKRKNKKIDDERFSLRKQMSLDEAERTKIEGIKSEEKRSAEESVYATFAAMQREGGASKQKLVATSEGKAPRIADSRADSKKPDLHHVSSSTKQSQKAIFDASELEEIDIDALLNDEDIDDEDESGHSAHLQSQEGGGGGGGEGGGGKDLTDADDVGPEDDIKFIPPPRSVAKTSIVFTPRIFPTPLRESKAAEEEDWVAKNRRHLKKHGAFGRAVSKGNGVDVSEEDPAWLKAKGDDFLRGGDVRSALNAYSAALDADDHMTACYANRAICYFKLGMLSDCILDCTTGMEQLREEGRGLPTPQGAPQVPRRGPSRTEADTDVDTFETNKAHSSIGSGDAGAAVDVDGVVVSLLQSGRVFDHRDMMYAKLCMRRGAAHCQLGGFDTALGEYEGALALLTAVNTFLSALSTPSDAERVMQQQAMGTLDEARGDVGRIRLLRDTDKLKKEGDGVFAKGDVAAAVSKYTQALALVPVHVGCLSNRSACKIAKGDFQGCVDDCTTALALLELNTSSNASSSSSSTTSSSAPGVGLVGGWSSQRGVNMLVSILPPAGSDKRKSWVLKTVSRRGAALARLGRLDEAVADFSLACSMDPKNEALKVDLNRLVNFREGKRSGGGIASLTGNKDGIQPTEQ